MGTAVIEKVEFRPVTTSWAHVPVHHRKAIEAKAAKLTARLARLEAPAPVVEFGPVVSETSEDEFGRKWTYDVYSLVTVTGVEALFSGWSPVAVLDHRLAADEALVSLFPAAVAAETACPEVYRTTGPTCDHCGIKIRRNTTVVFHHEDGRWIQVGSTCILDFIGIDPKTILMLAEPMVGADEEEGGGPRAHGFPDPLSFLAVAAEFTLRYGFVPTSAYDKSPTRDDASGWFTAKDPLDVYGFTDTTAGAGIADLIAAWLPEAGDSDYMVSARLALRADRVFPKTVGLIASLPHVYSLAMGRKAEAAIADVLPPSEYVGTIGQKKFTFTGTVVKVLSFDGDYGVRRLVSLRDAAGVIVSTFGTGATLFAPELHEGATATIVGTVKAHEDRGYGRQTMLIRATVTVAPEEEGS